MDKYEEHENKCNEIRSENAEILDAFDKWMKAHGLSKKTTQKHRTNIDFYINEFLLYDDATKASDGADGVGMFLGYWFIKKAMWASAGEIKSNATSLKKFYAFMSERGDVAGSDVRELKDRIKEEMPEWLETVRRYDDPSLDAEEVWQL